MDMCMDILFILINVNENVFCKILQDTLVTEYDINIFSRCLF